MNTVKGPGTSSCVGEMVKFLFHRIYASKQAAYATTDRR